MKGKIASSKFPQNEMNLRSQGSFAYNCSFQTVTRRRLISNALRPLPIRAFSLIITQARLYGVVFLLGGDGGGSCSLTGAQKNLGVALVQGFLWDFVLIWDCFDLRLFGFRKIPPPAPLPPVLAESSNAWGVLPYFRFI